MADQRGREAPNRELAAVVGFYPDSHSILEAMKKLRAANYKSFDAHTPFPIHGMDDAQGLKRSMLPWVTFVAGLTGCLAGFALQYWTSVIDWPLNVGGKPPNSWPAFVPVMFECTILFAGIATVFSMLLGFCRLPNTNQKAFDPGITRDRFALVIEAAEERADEAGRYKKFDADEAMTFLKQIGATDVQKVYAEGWF